MIRPSNKLLSYLRRAEEHGLSPEKILKDSGVDWNGAETFKSVDPVLTAQLFDLLARRTPPDFALACGRATRISDFGIVGMAMISSPTLRDALECWVRYSEVAMQPFATSIRETGGEWRMHFSPQRLMTADAQRFCLEASIAAHEAVIGELTGASPQTISIDFAFERPASTICYEKLNAPVVRFSRPTTVYCGKRADLDRKIPVGDKETCDAYLREFESFLAQLADARPLNEQIENIIRASVGRIPSVDEMAASLGLSRRSFQRELERHNTNYVDLVKNFRISHVADLLEKSSFNVKHTAYVLGFQDVGSFRRAFQVWMGQSVLDWCSERAAAGQATAQHKYP